MTKTGVPGQGSPKKTKGLYLLVVEPTHLKNMCKSNWIISPNRDKTSPSISFSAQKFKRNQWGLGVVLFGRGVG